MNADESRARVLGAHGEHGAVTFNGGLAQSPQWGPGVFALIRGPGAKTP